MLWGVLPVHNILVFMSESFRTNFLIAKDEFEHQLLQLENNFELKLAHHDWINKKFHTKMKITCRKTTEMLGLTTNSKTCLFLATVVHNCLPLPTISRFHLKFPPCLDVVYF